MEMVKKKDVLIIIPAYNEGKTIGDLLDKLKQPEFAEFADVLVMNDASKDNTAQVVREKGHTVITHVFNLATEVDFRLGINMQKEMTIAM